MITKDDVLKAIVECKKPDGHADFPDISNKLNTDIISIHPLLEELKIEGYTIQTLTDVTVTKLGESAYKELTFSSKAKKSIFNFSKLSLKKISEIIVGIIIGLGIAYLVYHFGWQ